MKVFFVRHGKSIANAGGIVGTPETPLAEEGLEQARITGQDLRNHNVTTIICSTYIRAQQTAEIIAGELGIPVHNIITMEELGERRMGTLEGKPKVHETSYFYDNDTENEFEPQQVLIDRLKIAITKIKNIASKAEGATVVVGHATSGFYLLQVAKGRRTHAEFDPFNQMNNAEFVEIEFAKR